MVYQDKKINCPNQIKINLVQVVPELLITCQSVGAELPQILDSL